MKDENIIKKRKLKKCLLPFIMTIITFIIALWFFLTSRGDPTFLRMKIIFFGLLPFILFFILFLISYFKCHSEKVRKAITTTCCVLVFFVCIYYMGVIFITAFEETENPARDIKYYKDIVYGKLLNAFPKKIPEDAENVQLFYSPGALQAGTKYVLYYVDRNMSIDKFDKAYRNKAKWIGHINDYDSSPGIFFGLVSYDLVAFNNSNDFIIYLIDSHCNNVDRCNHASFLFSAFNEKTKEVIYVSEEW